jgi:preprotein translocase subunit SecY
MVKGNYKELIKKISNTIFMIFIYRIGCYITVPGVNPIILNKIINQTKGGFLSSLDVFAGGSISRATLFSLGVYPYISASLLMQFLTSNIGLDYFIALKKKGNTGQEQISAYTKYITIVIALFHSIGYCTYIATQKYQGFSPIYLSKPFFFFIAIIHMLAGVIFLIWLGNQITKKGICNGISLIIFSGIISNVPKSFFKTYSLLKSGTSLSSIVVFGLFLICMIFFTLFIETSKRNIAVRYPYSKLFESSEITNNHNLPMKINNASIMPSIMAAAVIMLPGILSFFVSKLHLNYFAVEQFFSLFTRGNFLYYFIYGFAIIFFTIVYTPMTFEPNTLAGQLQKSNCILENWRPGNQTALQLEKIIQNLSYLSALYLFILCVFVDIFLSKTNSPFYFGGTSLIICISVGLEIYDSYRSHSSDLQCLGVVKNYAVGSLINPLPQ